MFVTSLISKSFTSAKYFRKKNSQSNLNLIGVHYFKDFIKSFGFAVTKLKEN